MNFFYVTSFITEKVSKRVIDEENIEEYLMISDERYDPISKNYVESKKIFDIEKPLKKNLIKNWKSIIRGKKKISRLSKGTFEIYVPNAKIDNVGILMSHKKCANFSFIEEGFTSYCEFNDIREPKVEYKRRLKNYIAYLGAGVENGVFEEGYKKAYGISEYSFPKWKRRKILEPGFSKKNANVGTNEESCILVLDSMRTIGEVKHKIYLSCLSRVVSILENKYKNIKYKLHPDNYNKLEEKIFKSTIKNSKCVAEEIEKSVQIEEFAIRSGMDVIVNLSSTGLYCVLYSDCEVYTFYEMFKRGVELAGIDDQNILGFERFVPDVFWDNVTPVRKE